MKRTRFVLTLLVSLLVVVSFFCLPGESAEKDFTVSFGTGGMGAYKVIDNTCFVYTLNYPKEEKQISQLMNNVLTDSIGQARRQFSKENDGLVNVKVVWQFLGKEKIIYQVCGDVVRKSAGK